MALVIVEKGKKTDDQKWAGSCRRCGSKAECLRSDIKNYKHDQMKSLLYENSEFSWEICPECGAGNSTGYGGLLMYPASECDIALTRFYQLTTQKRNFK